MSKVDPVQERERLENVYSAMADEELNQLLDAADELSETAREVLKAEIERRGGHVEYEWEPTAAEALHPKLVTIARFRDLDKATVARCVLESAGIESFLADQNVVRMDWFWSNMIGNMRLMVREEDAEGAAEILAQPVPRSFATDHGQEVFEQPKCPKCGSHDIEFEGWDRGVGLITAAILAPVPIRSNTWKCHTCGSRWRELAESQTERQADA
jgi:hypothetical protein